MICALVLYIRKLEFGTVSVRLDQDMVVGALALGWGWDVQYMT